MPSHPRSRSSSAQVKNRCAVRPDEHLGYGVSRRTAALAAVPPRESSNCAGADESLVTAGGGCTRVRRPDCWLPSSGDGGIGAGPDVSDGWLFTDGSRCSFRRLEAWRGFAVRAGRSRSARSSPKARTSIWSVVNVVRLLRSCSTALVAREMSSEINCRLARYRR
jgi:hypothetical protein